MNTKDDNKAITLPLAEYNKMLGVVNEKKDIRVLFSVHLDNKGEFLHQHICTIERIYELNTEKLNEKILIQMSETISQIISWQKGESDKYKGLLKSVSNELLDIKNKWWYKLFN